MAEPWRDWIPGVLSPRQVSELGKEGLIMGATFTSAPPGLSSFDLHLGDDAWLLARGSVKPSSTERYSTFLDEFGVPQDSVHGVFTLEPKKTYVFKIREQLHPRLLGAGISGQATAKSSIGRMDVLARLIVDGMDGYEGFKLNASVGPDMYLEVTSMTFPVRIKVGSSLSQLRLFYGDPDQCVMRGGELARTIGTTSDCRLRVDLSPVNIGGREAVAFCAKPDRPHKPIPLWQDEHTPDPCDYWQLCSPEKKKRLQLQENAFYILRSKELLKLPSGVAAYCQAIDETIGEMRIHYAGFVHPWFGRERNDGSTGTPLIFEVRGHDLNVLLLDNEVMARITVYRMSEEVQRPAAAEKSPYDDQTLQLSKYFGRWPERLKVDEQGNASPA